MQPSRAPDRKQRLIRGALSRLSVLMLLGLTVTASPQQHRDNLVCLPCIRIRVGLPRIVRGPARDIADNRFSEVRLPGGGFRGFDAHGETRAIDGRSPSDMGGPERVVLRPGKPGAIDSCGQWIQRVELTGDTLLAFVHDETACNYAAGQTHKSMSLAVSTDYGLTWNDLGQIIAGTDAPTPNRNTGEGDCTAINGEDGYYYQYCGRPRDGAVIVARAPVSAPGPGHWKKYDEGQWDQPGLGGDATSLGSGLGTSAARWKVSGTTILLGWQPGGMGVFFSDDHVHFMHLNEPLLTLDPGVWKRPDPSEVLGYAVLLDAKDGGTQLSDSWMLTYAYWPPYSSDKYLVFRNVEATLENAPVTPQVGVLLARWYDPALHDRWSTTGAVPGNDDAYRFDLTLGYLMTARPATDASVRLEDCVVRTPGGVDHMLEEQRYCDAGRYQRLRTAGWLFAHPRDGTVPLYRCYAPQDRSHFSSNAPDCEKLGRKERLLGYALAQ